MSRSPARKWAPSVTRKSEAGTLPTRHAHPPVRYSTSADSRGGASSTTGAGAASAAAAGAAAPAAAGSAAATKLVPAGGPSRWRWVLAGLAAAAAAGLAAAAAAGAGAAGLASAGALKLVATGAASCLGAGLVTSGAATSGQRGWGSWRCCSCTLRHMSPTLAVAGSGQGPALLRCGLPPASPG